MIRGTTQIAVFATATFYAFRAAWAQDSQGEILTALPGGIPTDNRSLLRFLRAILC